MADANVILRIGSALGPGGFASLQAGIQMVGKLTRAIAANVKAAEKFAQVYSHANVKAIRQADSATKGLIDTMALLQKHTALVESGAHVTDERFKTLAATATHFAQKTGKDITATFNQLADSVAKGNSRSLKQLGVDLEETEDLALAQEEAFVKLEAKYGDVTVQVENMSEALFVWENAVDTAIGVVYNESAGSLGLTQVIVRAASGVTNLTNAFADSEGEFGDYILDVATLGEKLEAVAGFYADLVTPAVKKYQLEQALSVTWTDKVVAALNNKAGALAAVAKHYLGSASAAETYTTKLRNMVWWQNVRDKGNVFGFAGEELPPSVLAGAEGVAGGATSESIEAFGSGAKKPPKGAGARASRPDLAFTVGEAYGGTEDLLTGATPGRVDADFYDTSGIYEYDSALDDLLETQRELNMTQEDHWAREYAIHNERMELEQQRAEFMDEMRRSEMAAVEADIDRKLAVYQKYYALRLQFADEFFGNLAGLMALRNKTMFKIGKVAAVAQGTVQTILASIDAFRSAMQGLPYPANIIAAPISAAAVGVAGMAMVARISKTKYGDMSSSGMGGGKGVALGRTGAASGMGANTTGAQAPQQQQQTEVTVILSPDGERFMDFMVEQNDTRKRHMLPAI